MTLFSDELVSFLEETNEKKQDYPHMSSDSTTITKLMHYLNSKYYTEFREFLIELVKSNKYNELIGYRRAANNAIVICVKNESVEWVISEFKKKINGVEELPPGFVTIKQIAIELRSTNLDNVPLNVLYRYALDWTKRHHIKLGKYNSNRRSVYCVSNEVARSIKESYISRKL